MKKILKKEVIIAFIVGIILASSIAVYAATINAKDIDYKDGKTVEYALNDLYGKSNKTPQQVATLTTPGATYTFQNDGYIIGTIKHSDGAHAALIYFNEINDAHRVGYAPPDENNALNTSIYATKNTTIYTRANYGIYNLTCYEFK